MFIFGARQESFRPEAAFFTSGRARNRNPLSVADKDLDSSDIRKFLEKIQKQAIEGFKRLWY